MKEVLVDNCKADEHESGGPFKLRVELVESEDGFFVERFGGSYEVEDVDGGGWGRAVPGPTYDPQHVEKLIKRDEFEELPS